jgi:hypothetical protein
MPFKDHYKTLGIATNASLQDIKKAYRALAHKYHPDKNPDDAFAQGYFRSVHEAYSVLADEKKKRIYDEERYFAGLASRKEPEQIDATWILRQARKLRHHMEQVDSYRMNHKALHDYVLQLLSDDHIAVLQQAQEKSVHQELVTEILTAVKRLRFDLFPAVANRLQIVAGNDPALQGLIAREYREQRLQHSWRRYYPLLVLVVTIIICVVMYVYSRRG